MMPPVRTRLWGLVLLASVLPHLPYLWGYFFMDDFWHLAFLDRGDYIFSTWRVGRDAIDQLWYMSRPVFPQMAWVEQIQYYFRPVYLIFLWLDRLLVDYWAPGYHLHSQLWHSLNALLVVLAGRRLGLSFGAAAFAGILFGLHPMSAESLGWISARCYLHMTTFSLLSLLAWLRWREDGAWRWLVWHLLALLLALGSHEMAAVLPLVLLTAELMGWRALPGRPAYTAMIRLALPALALAALFLVWRIGDDGGPATWSMSRANFFTFKLFGPLAVSGYNLVEYLKLTILGIPPISFVSRPHPLTGLDTWPVWIAALPLIAFALWRLRRHALALAFLWLAGFAASILWMPPSGRYLYGLMPGLVWLLAAGLERLWAGRHFLRPLVAASVVLVGLWWVSASLISSVATSRSHGIIRENMEDILVQLQARPQVTDLYLLHVWPMMVSSPGAIPLLAQRPDLRVHLLTYASTLYHPHLSPAKTLATLAFPVDGKWFEPLEIETRRLGADTLVVSSTPEGFFTGPATFGWNSQQLPQPPEGEIRLPHFSVRVGPRIGSGGVRSLLFTLPMELDSPGNLFMEHREGRMQVWEPAP